MSTESNKPKKKATAKKAAAKKEAQETAQPVYALEPLTRHEWSSEEEVGVLLAALIKCHKATNVLELGTLEGFATKFMIDAVSENNGSFATVDIEDKRHQSIKDAMDEKGYKFHLGSSIDVCKALPKNSFDLIYIDTIHEWHHAQPEFRVLEHLIKQGGMLVYHDTIKFPDMKRLSNYVRAFRYQSITIRTPEGNGLSIIQK